MPVFPDVKNGFTGPEQFEGFFAFGAEHFRFLRGNQADIQGFLKFIGVFPMPGFKVGFNENVQQHIGVVEAFFSMDNRILKIDVPVPQ